MTNEEKQQRLKELQLEKLQAELAEAKAAEQSVTPAPETHYVRNALDLAGRGLDYMGGLTRTGAAQLAESATGRDIVKEGDWDRAMSGQAPGTAQYIENAGIPEGATLGDAIPAIKGKWFDPSVRGVAGFVGDVALDPLTYLSGGVSALAKSGTTESKLLKALQLANKEGKITKAGNVAQKVLNPIESFNKYRSDKNYASAFSKADKVSKSEGNAYKISDILKSEGFMGDSAKAAERVVEINKSAGQEIGDILKEAQAKGAKVDLTKSFDESLDVAKELRKLSAPEAKKLADEIESRVLGVWETHGSSAPIDIIQQEKSFINDLIGKTGFASGDEAALTTKAKKAISSSLASGNEAAVKSIDKDLYDRLKKANSMYSSTNKEIQKAMTGIGGQVAEANGMFGGSKVDAILMGLGLAGGSASGGASFAPYAAKKLGQAALSTEGKSIRGAIGKGISELPDYALKDSAARQLWEKILEKNNEKR